MIDPKSSIPLYIQLKDEIEAKVIRGEYPDGYMLPTHKDMCKIYNVSMITVRKALEILEKHNIVSVVPGKGTYVRTPKIRNELVKITRFSKTLQESGLSGYTKILGYEPAAYSSKMETLMENSKYGPLCSLTLLGCSDKSPLVYYVSYLRKELGDKMIKVARDLEKNRIPFSTVDLYEKVGVVIQRMEQSIKAINADSIIARLLEIQTGKSVLLLETIVYDIDNVPLECKSGYYRSDKYAFRLLREI